MKAEYIKAIVVILIGFAIGAMINMLPAELATGGAQYAIFGGVGVIGTISAAAKNLFSGANKEARQERKEIKKAAKQAAKETKEAAKKAITTGGVGGANLGAMWAKLVDFVKKNWVVIIAVIGVVVAIWYFFLRKPKGVRRRRSSGGKGSAAMRARMAKVRAARRRKRK